MPTSTMTKGVVRNTRQRRLGWFGWTMVVLLLGLPISCVCKIGSGVFLTPPPSMQSLAAFMKWQPSLDTYVWFQHDGAEYVIAYKKESPWVILLTGPFFPSGPAVYVFDATGQFVDWSADVGDDSEFVKKWSPPNPYRGPRLTRAQLQKWAGISHTHPSPQ
ncbi:MAG: hypothetical protein IT443_04230 [Phycisphaeraceae bacterium]|nr:hypothetical protein [Phycisphaeraceae bacterium]